MDKAFEFLNKHRDVAFATVDGDKPEIRVFQVMKIQGKNLFFATSPKKKVFAQMQHNPNIEILGMSGNISVKISGKVIFDLTDDICREIYAGNPVLHRLYKEYTDLVYFRLEPKELFWFDLTPTPPEQIHIVYDNNRFPSHPAPRL